MLLQAKKVNWKIVEQWKKPLASLYLQPFECLLEFASDVSMDVFKMLFLTIFQFALANEAEKFYVTVAIHMSLNIGNNINIDSL